MSKKGDTPPDLTPEDDEILDRVWDSVAEDNDKERAKRFVDEGTKYVTITPPKEKDKKLAEAVKKVTKKEE